jgi:Protein of unknwon function (DUF3310)
MTMTEEEVNKFKTKANDHPRSKLMDDPVNHPKHYNAGGIETIEMVD